MPERDPTLHAGRLATWLQHHAFSLVASVGRMLKRPWSTLLTVGVMAMALALPLALWLAMANLARLDDGVRDSRGVTLFLAPGSVAAEAQALAATLRGRGDVASVDVVAPAQALSELRARAELAVTIEALGEETATAALPTMLRIVPRGDEAALVEAARALPDVERVQHDAHWRQRLQAWLDVGIRLAQVLGLLLGIGALLVVGNTVRLDIQSRREEIGVLQLLGASDGFVRRPFLYLGAGYGLLAGAGALAALAIAARALQPSLTALASRYGGSFDLHGLPPLQALAFVLASGVLGWAGAALVAGHFLRQARSGAR